eukprot:TRINITY_DN4004_c0_g1_i16.p1 TRINITY_DN4004_c0_g1~~TRINITY_DN4004_c0_g1_i16.p1  ORF type:complete len:1179 (-),score=88.10 TRINITY_DN4004_c0_g1_i16:773-4309(-)
MRQRIAGLSAEGQICRQCGLGIIGQGLLRVQFEWLKWFVAIVLLLPHMISTRPSWTIEQRISRKLLQEGTLDTVDTACGWGDTIEQEPFVASIQLQNPVGTAWWHLCEGIQIAESIVLTTASCIVDLRPTGSPTNTKLMYNGTLIPNIFVAVSPFCRHQKGRWRAPVLGYYMHPNFVKRDPDTGMFQQNDVALLVLNVSEGNAFGQRLPTGFDINSFFVSLRYDLDWGQISNRTYSLVGYGQKNENDGASMFNDPYYRNMLQHDVDTIRFLDREACGELLQSYIPPEESNLTAEDMFLCGEMINGTLCTGDYGAPITINNEDDSGVLIEPLLSVYSWSPQRQCEGTNQPVMFTNISHYSDWIIEMVVDLKPEIQMVEPVSIIPPAPVVNPSRSPSDPEANIPSTATPTHTGNDFQFWLIGLIAGVVVIFAVIAFLLRVGSRRYGNGKGGYCYLFGKNRKATDFSNEEIYYMTGYTTDLIPSLNKDLTKTNDTLKGSFSPTGLVDQSKEKDGFWDSYSLSPDSGALQLNLNQVSFPINTHLLLSSLYNKALTGLYPKLFKNLPQKQRLVMINRPYVNAVVSIHDKHPYTCHYPCHFPSSQIDFCVDSNKLACVLVQLSQLSQLNLQSMIPQVQIHRQQSQMLKDYLHEREMQAAENQQNGQITTTNYNNSLHINTKTKIMFPMANVEALEEMESEIVDEGVQTNTEQMLISMREKLQACRMYIDVPTEIELGRRLGGGNFGTVYQGTWLTQGKQIPVAVKIMKAGHCDSGHWYEYAQQFMDEINMMNVIRSNFVIQLYGGYITREEFIIVMELMQQGSLDNYIRKRHKGQPLPLLEVVQIMLQIARGLSELHPEVVHRDLKPQNILIDAYNRVKIGDLGLSKMKAGTWMSVSEMKGTPAYIAPEVFMNNHVSEKCDMYAFAVITWECITGQKPWAQYQMPVQIMHDVIWKGKRPPLPNDCHESVRSIIEKCWDKEPMKRLSAHEVGSRLQRLLFQLDSQLAKELNLFQIASRANSRDLFSRGLFQPKLKTQRKQKQSVSNVRQSYQGQQQQEQNHQRQQVHDNQGGLVQSSSSQILQHTFSNAIQHEQYVQLDRRKSEQLSQSGSGSNSSSSQFYGGRNGLNQQQNIAKGNDDSSPTAHQQHQSINENVQISQNILDAYVETRQLPIYQQQYQRIYKEG